VNIIFSFIIPTYKNSSSLVTCVTKIIEISNKLQLTYELIIVDNFEGNEFICSLFEFEKKGKLKIIKNPIIGAHHSRRLGLFNSSGDIIIFVDDDNYLTENYLLFIKNSFSKNVNSDIVIGCASQPFHDIDWKKYKFEPHSFACGSLKETKFKQDIPVYWGAGMCMSKQLAIKVFKHDLIVDGRMDKNNYIMSGEDHEVSLRSYFLGANFLYFNDIGLIHDFNLNRLNDEYYSKIQIGFVYAAWILKLYYFQNKWKFLFKNKVLAYLLNFVFGFLYFLNHPCEKAGQLILWDVLSFTNFSKRYNIVKKFV